MTPLDPWTIMSALVLEDGRAWGDAAVPLQLADARAVIEPDQPYHFWTRSRGFSKTGDAAGVAVSLLPCAPPAARLYWLASDSDQGTLCIDSIAGYVARTPLLRGSFEVQARKVVCTSNGASLEILAADAASSWGIRPWCVFVDEFSAWADTAGPRRLWESVSSAVAKSPTARLVVFTSAGDPRHFSFKVLEHARTSALWRTSEASGPSPWMSADRLAEQRARLPEGIYAQLFENVWAEAEGAFLDADAIRRAFALPGPSAPLDGRRYVGTLDVGLVNDRTVLAIGHREGGAVHLDLLQAWKGSKARPVNLGEVRDAIIRAHERYRLTTVRFDRWQAHRLAEELGAAGIRCDPFEFTAASKQRYSASLLQALNTDALRLYEPGNLEEELRGLTIRTTGGGWSFDHSRGGHDDQAVALAMLVLELSANAPAAPGGSYSGLPPSFTQAEWADRERRSPHSVPGVGFVGSTHLDAPQPGEPARTGRRGFGSFSGLPPGGGPGR